MKPILQELRVHQWAKNALIFLPALAAHRLSDRGALSASIFAFLSFSFSASAIYVFNDLLDLRSDRNHPEKRKRPLASGAISTRMAWGLVGGLLLLSLLVGLKLPWDFFCVLSVYIVSTTLYSLYLKRVVLLDVFMLAGFYTLRVFAGSEATGIEISEWLLAFSMFFFLSLALAKRFAELQLLQKEEVTEAATRRGYSREDADFIPIMGVASGFMTSLVMALYINSDKVRSLYHHPGYLWFICPLILYWIGRVWIICHRGELKGDPVVFALKDWVSFAVLVLAASVMKFAS